MKCCAPRRVNGTIVGLCHGEVTIRAAGVYCEAVCPLCDERFSAARLLTIIDELKAEHENICADKDLRRVEDDSVSSPPRPPARRE